MRRRGGRLLGLGAATLVLAMAAAGFGLAEAVGPLILGAAGAAAVGGALLVTGDASDGAGDVAGDGNGGDTRYGDYVPNGGGGGDGAGGSDGGSSGDGGGE